jgi:nucleoside-diphosphate-sugar epimerase
MQTNSFDDQIRGRVALVTGGLGFIGGALCERLRAAGATVHTASRREAPPGALNTHWRLDLSDADAVATLVRDARPDYVFHLASHVMGAPDLQHVLPAFRGNLQSTVNLLTELAAVGCTRFVTTGSLVEPQADARGIPSSPYAAAKWASSDYVRMFHAVYGFPAAIARVFMVYGPGQQDLTKLVPYVIQSLLRGEDAKITSGARLIDWIYVDDVVDGLIRLAIGAGVDGASVDLGSGAAITIREIVEKIYALMTAARTPAFGALSDRPLEPFRIANVAESKRLIGWSPQVALNTGLQRTVEWYRERFAGQQ